ncbi:MAG: c-type cytochrome, partial [bacterium]|nr:c-type cytochrome [bacterium]
MITGLKGRSAALLSVLVALLILATPLLARAQEASSAQTAWRLLDYLSVDYSGAVKDGKVISPSEYAEMNEFAGQVRERIAGLPATKAQPVLVSKAESLQAAIAAKQAPDVVSAKAHGLAAELLAAYPTPLAPTRAPDLARGAALYAENCSACHGETGKANGPNAAGLDPPPIAFADAGRARQRSVFGLYQVIQQGLDGTAMAS